MKKTIIILAVASLAIGALPAQGWGSRAVPESVKIEGTLQLHNGQFAVSSGNTIYYVPRIGRYVGFIDNLKEGSNVSFEGYVSGNFLLPVKMTLSGKSYDLAAGAGRRGDFGNPGGRGFNGFNGGFGPCYGGYVPGSGGNSFRGDYRRRR
jgi:hypothetical protein